MLKCYLADRCPLFTQKTGYSPELYETMRTRFCYGPDQPRCARLEALARIPECAIPDDLLPTEPHSGDGPSGTANVEWVRF